MWKGIGLVEKIFVDKLKIEEEEDGIEKERVEKKIEEMVERKGMNEREILERECKKDKIILVDWREVVGCRKVFGEVIIKKIDDEFIEGLKRRMEVVEKLNEDKVEVVGKFLKRKVFRKVIVKKVILDEMKGGEIEEIVRKGKEKRINGGWIEIE